MTRVPLAMVPLVSNSKRTLLTAPSVIVNELPSAIPPTAAPAAGTGNSRTSNQRAAPHDATQPNAKRKRDEYTYTRLADLQLGDANVWGTVSQFSQPKQTSGPDVMVTVTIVDESQQNGLQINVFASSEALLPQFKV